jgi:hypothetical protein
VTVPVTASDPPESELAREVQLRSEPSLRVVTTSAVTHRQLSKLTLSPLDWLLVAR